jgi:hypothetical protein
LSNDPEERSSWCVVVPEKIMRKVLDLKLTTWTARNDVDVMEKKTLANSYYP